MSVAVSMFAYHVCAWGPGAHGSQKGVFDAWELELRMLGILAVCILGIKSGSSADSEGP